MIETLSEIQSFKPSELMVKVKKEGTLLFDSVGHFPANYGSPVSILAVSPEEVLRGGINDTSDIEKLLRARNSVKTDLGYPDGGLAGWVDYNGDYTFGVYDRFWVYAHEQGRWIQEGGSIEIEGDSTSAEVCLDQWRATMSKEDFIAAVIKAQEYIASGHIYQVNLAQKFITEVIKGTDLYSLYAQLRRSSPAPMACYGNLGGVELLSSSPETFLKMSGRVIEARPIKGTMPRFKNSERDNLSAYQLRTSQKENAELVMITDLLRNDLGKVCEYGSVTVDELLSVEKLEHVYHMVSTVRGQIKSELSQVEALQSCLPGGSITGAPKIRAMDIIKELEVTDRGLYTGVVGYLGYNGESQFNIAIRSMVREGKELSYHVGAGIVADSDPAKEYDETLVKAEGIRKALSLF